MMKIFYRTKMQRLMMMMITVLKTRWLETNWNWTEEVILSRTDWKYICLLSFSVFLRETYFPHEVDCNINLVLSGGARSTRSFQAENLKEVTPPSDRNNFALQSMLVISYHQHHETTTEQNFPLHWFFFQRVSPFLSLSATLDWNEFPQVVRERKTKQNKTFHS